MGELQVSVCETHSSPQQCGCLEPVSLRLLLYLLCSSQRWLLWGLPAPLTKGERVSRHISELPAKGAELRLAVSDPFLPVVMVCWRNIPHGLCTGCSLAALRACAGCQTPHGQGTAWPAQLVQHAAVSRAVVTDESGPRSRMSLDCDSLTKLSAFGGELATLHAA